MARVGFFRGGQLSARRFAAVCLGVLAPTLGAAAPVANPPAHHVRLWTTDDGLPHNSVSRVLQDSTGFLWLATVGGLARFDGREFREFRPPAENRSLGFNIRGLAEERPGTLLVVPTGGGVLRLESQQWSVHPLTPVLTELRDSATDVQVDSRGNVWVGTGAGRVVRWSSAGHATTYGAREGVSAQSHGFSFAEGAAGDMWIAGDALVAIDAEGAVIQHGLAIEPRMIATGRNGRVLMWTERRLFRIEGRRVTQEAELSLPTATGTVRDLFEDAAGLVWIATTRQGLLQWREGQAVRVGTFPAVLSITQDREGNLWAATDGSGIAELREKSYHVFSSATGLSQEVVSSICQDSTGNVWIANRAGGLVCVGSDDQPHRRGPTGQRAFANALIADAEDRLWFGGGRNGLLRWDPREPDALLQLPAPQANLHLLFRARDDAIWFAGDPRRLGFYRGDEVKILSAAEDFPPQEIRAIAEDRAGNIWLGGRGGELLRWDGRRIQRFGAEHGFPRELIHALWVDTADRLWIGTVNGLVLKDGDRFRVLTAAQGLADDIIQQILEDDQGCLWFAARRGLFYAKTSELIAVARGTEKRVQSFRLGASEGLVGLTPTPNYQPAACKTRDGRLWFATAQGAVAIDPARVPRDLPPPPVLVDEVRVDGQLVSTPAGLRIPSGQHRVEFRFAALSFTAPESVILRHRLEGMDADWVDTGSERAISYTNLPPKNYVLRALARNSSGRWSAEAATFAFTVVPAWWETVSFRLAMVGLVTGLTAWAARVITQRRLKLRLQRLEQEHALEKERARIARDLHDDLGARLTEVGLVADRLVENAPPGLAPQLTGLAVRTRRLATELSSIVWTMNAANSSLDRLAGFLRRFAERVFRNTGITCIVTGADAIPPIALAPDPQHQLLAAAKEAMNNVLRHARAAEVRLDFRYTAGVFELQISDDGVGFVPDAASSADGNGLRNMRSRMAEIGGTVEITSAPARGTRVVLRLPCPVAKPER